MSLDYLKNIKPLEDAGVSSDAAIAEALVNSRLTHRDIPVTAAGDKQGASVLFLLTAQFPVMSMGSDQTWVGPLVDLRSTKSEVDDAMGVLMPYLQVQGSKVSSSTMPLSAKALYAITEAVKGIVPNLPPELNLAPEQVDAAVDAITGGRLFDSITAADVVAARDEHDDATLKDDAVNKVFAWNNGAIAAAEAARESGKTPAEIEQAARDVWGI